MYSDIHFVLWAECARSTEMLNLTPGLVETRVFGTCILCINVYFCKVVNMLKDMRRTRTMMTSCTSSQSLP